MKERNTAWSEQIRVALEAPLNRRGLGWSIALPLLLPFAFFYACAMKVRRFLLRGEAQIQLKDGAIRAETTAILAIGNLVVGGSGKSPLVRMLASAYLRQGYSVCVLSRGYGAPGSKRGVYCHFFKSSEASPPSGSGARLSYSDLSDELRELVVFLQLNESDVSERQPSLPPLLIAQNPKRREGLAESLVVAREMGQRDQQGRGLIVLLDDGLQHLRCPRDLEICVWPFASSLQAPRLPLPLGYYREGMGQGIHQIAATYSVHVWNGAPRGDSRVTQRLGRFPKDGCHFGMDMSIRWFDGGMQPVDLAKSLEGRIPLVVTGIADPQRFVKSVQNDLDSKHGRVPSRAVCVHFRDHGSFESKVVRRAVGGGRFVLIVTLKDWCRWSGGQEFDDFVATGDVVIGVAQADLYGFASVQRRSADGDSCDGGGIAAELLHRALEARKCRLAAMKGNDAD